MSSSITLFANPSITVGEQNFISGQIAVDGLSGQDLSFFSIDIFIDNILLTTTSTYLGQFQISHVWNNVGNFTVKATYHNTSTPSDAFIQIVYPEIFLTVNIDPVDAINDGAKWGLQGDFSYPYFSGDRIQLPSLDPIDISGKPIDGWQVSDSGTQLTAGENFVTLEYTILPVTVSIQNSGTSTINQGDTRTLTATVVPNFASSSGVTWSIVSGAGTLTSPSGNTIIYTAPHGAGANGNVVVKAVSNYDNTKYATIALTIPPVQITLTVNTTGPFNQHAVNVQPYTASVSGTIYTTLTWSIVEAGFASSHGTINSSNGLITLMPYGSNANGTYTLKAILNDDTSIYRTGSVIVNPTVITVNTTSATYDQAHSGIPFTVTVSGVDGTVTETWGIQSNAVAWTARSGSLNSSSGAIVAPYGWASPNDAAGAYTVRAVINNNGDTSEYRDFTLNVNPIVITITSKPAGDIKQKETKILTTASVSGTEHTNVIWSVTDTNIDNPSASFVALSGSIVSNTGSITAPYSVGSLAAQRAEGHYTLNVVHGDDSRKTDNTTFIVDTVSVVIDQGRLVRVNQDDSYNFTATISGSTENGVTWSVEEGATGGAVNGSGVYTAPTQEGQYHVIATHANDPEAIYRTLITVPPIRVSLTPAIIKMDQSDTRRFSARVINYSDKSIASWTATGAAAAALGDPTDKWFAASNATNLGRWWHSAVVMDNKMYVLGGITVDGPTNDMIIYDLIGKTWMRGKPLEAEVAINGHSAVVHNGKMYIFGGGTTAATSDYPHSLSKLYEYDPQVDSWTLISQDSNNIKKSHTAVVYGNKMYLYGGITNHNNFRYYDFSTGNFVQIRDMGPSYQFDTSSVVYNGKLYFIKGRDANSVPMTRVNIYDISSDTFSFIDDSISQTYTNSVLYGTDIYIFGGLSGFSFRKLDLNSNTFSSLADFYAHQIGYSSMIEYDGFLHAFSGKNINTILDDHGIYDIEGEVIEYTSSATRGSYYLTATVNAPGSLKATSKIIVPDVTVSIFPDSIILDQGQEYDFSAEVLNTTSLGVTWSLTPSTHGTFDDYASNTSTSNPTKYIAPTIPGIDPTVLQNNVSIVVTTDDSSIVDQSNVTLQDVVTNINASTLTLEQGETYQFYAWINNSVYPWSHEGYSNSEAWNSEDIIVGTKWYIYVPDSFKFLIYDFSSPGWSASATHSAASTSYDGGIFSYGGYIYKYGGGYSSFALTVTKYSIGLDSWSSDFVVSDGDIYSRRNYAHVFYNNLFYILSGNNVSGLTLSLTDHCFTYNPANDAVTTLSFKTPYPVLGKACIIGDVLYLIGTFFNGNQKFDAIYSRNLASGTEWTRLEDPILSLRASSIISNTETIRVAAVGNLIYCIGPDDDIQVNTYNANYGRGMVYDTVNDNWYLMSRDTDKPKIKTPFAYYSANSKLYSLGSGRNIYPDYKEMRSYDLGNFGITWAILEGATGGTISGTGLYTPGTTAGTYHINVYTAADPSVIATTIVTINDISVTVYPSTITLDQKEQYLFTAGVSGTTNKSVIWSVQNGGAGGTINSQGIYQAPSTAGTDTIIATSVADPTKTSTATITVSSVTAQIEPSTAILLESGTQTFRCAVQGNNDKSVTWSAPDGGSINGSGVFTAPSSNGTYRVRATTTVGSVIAEAVVNVVADVYWKNRIGLLLANNPFELCGIAEFAQPIIYRAALAKTLAKTMGGAGIHGGGAKEFSLLGPQIGSSAVNKTKYPPVSIIIYDNNKEAWFFRTTNSSDIVFSDADTNSANLFVVAGTDIGSGQEYIIGGIKDISFVAQSSDTASPNNSILLGTGKIVNSEFTTFTANYDIFIEDIITLFSLSDTAAATENFESGDLMFLEGGDGMTIEAKTETSISGTVQNAIVNVDLATLSGMEFDINEALKIKIRNGGSILINTLDYAADGSLFSNLSNHYYGYITVNDGTFVLQNDDDLIFTGVDSVDTEIVASNTSGQLILNIGLKDTITSQHDWMVAQTINSFFDIEGGLAIGSYIISPTSFSDNRGITIPDPGTDNRYINTSGPYILAHISLTDDLYYVADDSETLIAWNEIISNVNWDGTAMFDPNVPTDIVLNYPGCYLVIAQVQFEENSSDAGSREVRIESTEGWVTNGFGSKKYVSGKDCTVQAHAVIMVREEDLSPNIVRVYAYQNSGDNVYLGDTGWVAIVRLSVKPIGSPQ